MKTNRTIDGAAKTISEVLKDKKYSIDYYQREYKWETKQLAELITDLTSKFLQLYSPEHKRSNVAQYPGYYLGSIIVSQKDTQPYIVDGQQRLTTLTLFLTYLRRLQYDLEDELDSPVVKIDDLIYSEAYGEKSFNLDIEDRNTCMHGLFEHGEYEVPEGAVESVVNIVERYSEIDGLFPDELKNPTLPYFIDWLKDRVQIVQITAYNDDDAYAIFETMNDRGLKLTPSDMLKGYLLANIDDGPPRAKANKLWRARMRHLEDLGEAISSDFLKTWLRSQYAQKIRERRKDAKPEDWDRIGTEFHRWVRSNHDSIGLVSSEAFETFVVRDMEFYAQQYAKIVAAQSTYDPSSPLRFIRYNSDNRFTLQNQLLLAPLKVGDDPGTIERKLGMVAQAVDIMLAWRIWNFRATSYSTMQYAMFNLMRDIRGLDVDDLGYVLYKYLDRIEENFDTEDELFVHQQNRSQLHRLLARITDYITVGSGQASNYVEFTGGSGIKYEVEHIWANRPERHTNEFAHENDFIRHRNRIGGLLLLPKQFNASFNDDDYAAKRPHYFGQNLLAASLDPQAYEKNPGFKRFVGEAGLAFKPYEEFTAVSIVERGDLYREIAKQVWDPENLLTRVNA